MQLSAFAHHNPISHNNKLPCKYSVRDVGFVDVHAFGWQVTLVKPRDFSPDQFQKLDNQVRLQLKGSNVHYLWVDENSSAWDKKQRQTRLANRDRDLSGNVWAVLSNSRGEHFPVGGPNSSEMTIPKFISEIQNVVDSAFRRELLGHCSESLCCLVLITSGKPEQDSKARNILASSIEQLKKQMWELEKPTERAPVSLVLDRKQQDREKWFLSTSGLAVNLNETNSILSQPHFGIFYGQGRRLGDWIPLESSSPQKLTRLAAVCGGDCECELDRDWLYGHQIVHLWDSKLENTALTSLNFDPYAAYVRSEVAAIVRKVGREASQNGTFDLGPGLMIHDLENLEANGNKERSKKTNNSLLPSGPGNDRQNTQEAAENENRDNSETGETQITGDNSDQPQPVSLPFSLIAILIVAAGITTIWSIFKSRG